MSRPRNGAPRWWGGAGVVVLFAVLYLVPLGLRPLLLPDEFRYAEIPREMLASGDWVVPRLDGLLYFEKPVLGYWLVAASQALLGGNRFAVRLPSALAVGLTALLAAFLVRRTAGEGSAAPARLTALVFLSCLLPAVLGTTAVLDGPLALFLTVTLVCFFFASAAPPSSSRERWLLLASGAACGLAFLTKGFLAPALAAVVAGGYLCWQRRWRDLVRMPWLPAISALAVATPWSLAVHSRAPDFWRFFFWHEHVQRFFENNSGQHPEPWYFFFAAVPLVLLPWSFFLPVAVAGYRGVDHPPERRDLIRFCVIWAAGTYLFFSASSGKLHTYILPALPAIAILLALGLATPGRSPRWWRGGGVAGAVVFFLIAAGGAIALLLAPPSSPLQVGSGAWGLLALSLALVAVTYVLAAGAARSAQRPFFVGWALVPLLLAAQLALPEWVQLSKAPGAFLTQHRARIGPQTVVLADSKAVHAACWIFARDDIVLVGPTSELSYGVERDGSGERAIELAEARQLIEQHRGRVVLVAASSRYDWWKPLLPAPTSEDSQGERGFVVATY